MNDLEFDYIIVGAGTAGALLANRLSANKNHTVLLIEAGGKDDYPWIHIPVGYLYCIGNARTDWLYQTQPEAHLNGRTLRYPRGKVLGGCSSINGMIYMRGQSRDYDQWATLTQDPRWAWRECLADFCLHEDHHLGAQAGHGAQDEGRVKNKIKPNRKANGMTIGMAIKGGAEEVTALGHAALPPHAGGPGPGRASQSALYDQWLAHRDSGHEWRVDSQRLKWPILDAFAQACAEYGIPPTPDFNQGNNEGVGYFEVNQKNGLRWNTAKAFLRPTCYARPNFEMWTHAHVSKLKLSTGEDGAKQCDGVEVFDGHTHVSVRAKREVILSAGSIGSPQILMLSGLGPAQHLQDLHLPVQVDLPGVGQNLQDHLQLRSVYQVQDTPTLNTLSQSWWGKTKMGVEYLFKRTGPLSMSPSQLGVFTKSDPQQAWPNLQYHVQPLSLDAFGEPLHAFNAITASVCHLNPTSRGEVKLNSPHFQDAPLIAPNYLSTPEDRDVAIRALRLTREIMQQPALKPFKPSEYKPGIQYQTDAELTQLAGELGTTIFHPVGTARMGPLGQRGAVLDSQCRVQNGLGGIVKGLRVVDASVMPTITSGNTNAPTLMIAEKVARMIASEDTP
jgi:choline dehydrogenase